MKYLMCLVILACLCVPAFAQLQPWCGAQTLSFQHNNTTTPVGYEELINIPSGNPQEDENVTVKNTLGPVLLDSYITPEGAFSSTSEVYRGLRRYRMYHYVDNAAGTTQANYSVYIRHSTGVETYLYSVLSEDINSLTPAEYLTSYVNPNDTPLLPDDRMVIKVFGQTTHSANVQFHFVYQGSFNTSHLDSGYFVCPSLAGGQPDAGISAPLAVGVLAGVVGALIIIRRKQ